MSTPRRTSSLYFRNKVKHEDNPSVSLLVPGTSANRPVSASSKQNGSHSFAPLSRRTSMSANLINELTNNIRYRKQKAKLEDRKSRSVEFLEIIPPNKFHDQKDADKISTATKRKSLSLDFKKALASFRDNTDPEEVLRTLQSNKDEPLSRSVGPGPFPRTEDNLYCDGVQLRPPRTDGLRQSQTIGCDPRRFCNFDIKGCVKIQFSDGKEVKLKKSEYIQFAKNSISKCDNTRCEVLKPGVVLKGIKLINKKEVELRDTNNQTCLLLFDSSKDAKQFLESEKVSYFIDTEKSTITKTLLKLLGKRSSREVLEKKGIYQNEPIFGNTLRNIYSTEHVVPKFIVKTMELIERPDNITSLGLYRTSGNLATIQKIRLEVDKGNLDILEHYTKDPDVLTGSLKLFFRELKEPLLSCRTCDNLLGFIKTDMNYGKKDRDNIRTILTHIPEANSETLITLIRHLIKVVEFKEQNKMDAYNLAVCWGPTIIFATDTVVATKDIVTQSSEATQLFDALLNFYINNPEELELRKKKHDFDTNRNMIHRQDSKDSIQSSDSGHSSKNKSSSNVSLDSIDEVLRKTVELIETHLNSEGLYKKNGSPEKVNKIIKKMLKKKLGDLDKYKNDVYELTDALKKYLREGCDSLVTKETVEYVNKLCDNTQWLEHNTRQRVITVVSEIPKKDLLFLIRHITKLVKYESSHRVPRSEMLFIWSDVLNDQSRIIDSEPKMTNFLKIVIDVFDETKPDLIAPTKGMNNGLLKDLKNLQREKDRISKYDNVPDETDYHNREETIQEEKTDEIEHTKL
ncbi:uncharacterized protein LOC114340927 isoform X2 [Diabrotica virgifera virgifera]|uniref:Rho-GAP domain-containing protein n=1 Tax=Diabrotica virgifera virgifera TaxID=50390 RepID=A0ABM5KSV1_DIAVI|nr:uncharacterized protein LOC114340927 isoform X2 [Diabrotica virgifera virgifera]